MKRLRRLMHSSLVVISLFTGSSLVWVFQSQRFLQLVERAVMIRFNLLNPQHWLQLLLWVD